MVEDADKPAVRVRAFAKINLGLSVTGCRPDGMHCIRSVMQTVDLHDDILLWSHGCREPFLFCRHPRVADGASPFENTVMRAAAVFGGTAGLRVYLRKRIPVGGGLGGGSSDAAAAAAVLAYQRCGCPPDELQDWRQKAAWVGADVPFFIHGGTQLAEGIGDRLQRMPDLPAWWVLMLVPPVRCETAEVYREWDRLRSLPRQGEETVRSCGLAAGDLASSDDPLALLPGLHNALEPAALCRYPSLVSWKEALQDAAGRPVSISGSGSTCYTLYRQRGEAERARQRLLRGIGKGSGARILLTRFRSGPGWQIAADDTGEEPGDGPV